MCPARSHVFIGGRDRGLAWLRRLANRNQLPAAVYCLREDDHEAEKYSPQIMELCHENGVPCYPRKTLKAEHEDRILALAPDLIVVMGWRTLISDRVLSAARNGSVGVHESLLPAYRGFAPVNWAVINGESRTGVTLFHMTATGIDDGDIVAQAAIPIGEHDTAAEVYRATALASLDLLESHFDRLLDGTGPRTPQDEGRATYTCSRTPEDGGIDWARPTREIHNLVRGLSHPYPGAFSHMTNIRYRIWSGRPVENARTFVGRIPGRIVAIGPDGIEVLTGDGSYRVMTAGEDGRDAVPAQTLFKSVRSGFSGHIR